MTIQNIVHNMKNCVQIFLHNKSSITQQLILWNYQCKFQFQLNYFKKTEVLLEDHRGTIQNTRMTHGSITMRKIVNL